MQNTITGYEPKHYSSIERIVARLNRSVSDLNEQAKLAKLTEALEHKQKILQRDYHLALDAMKLYLSQCESLHAISLSLVSEYTSTPKHRVSKRRLLFNEKENNFKELSRALQYYFNAKSTKDDAEEGLREVQTLLEDYSPSIEYTNNYHMLAELEYNPLVTSLNSALGTSFPTINLDGPAEFLGTFTIDEQTETDENENCN